jgi:CheY-like chemotaxis protein
MTMPALPRPVRWFWNRTVMTSASHCVVWGAQEKISDQGPDHLISDCCMPDIGGVERSARIKARPAAVQFPILLMSASLQYRVASGSSDDAFLRKPFFAEKLPHEVNKLLHKSASARPGYEGRE